MSYYNQPQNDGYVLENDFELPFKCHVGDEPETVANRFTGEKVELQPDAVAVYDTITGAERFGMWDTVRAGQEWFRTHYPKEYMILCMHMYGRTHNVEQIIKCSVALDLLYEEIALNTDYAWYKVFIQGYYNEEKKI